MRFNNKFKLGDVIVINSGTTRYVGFLKEIIKGEEEDFIRISACEEAGIGSSLFFSVNASIRGFEA